LSLRFLTSFLGDGFVPAPEYPLIPKTVGGAATYSNRGAIANCAAVA
jgi:hypothetical protein